MAKKIKLIRLAQHEFWRSVRVWKKCLSNEDIFDLVLSQRNKSLRAAIKMHLFAIVVTFWLLSDSSELHVRLMFMDFRINVAYVNFFLGLALFSGGLALLNYFMLNEFVRIVAHKLFKFDTAWAMVVLKDGDGAWSLPYVPQFRFFKSKVTHNGVIAGNFVITLLPFSLIAGLVYWALFLRSWKIIAEAEVSYDIVLTIAALIVATVPVLIAVVYNLSFTFEKNEQFIRWNFLFPLYKKFNTEPPRSRMWL